MKPTPWFALAALLLALPAAEASAQMAAKPLDLRATSILLDPREPNRRQLDQLTYAGGLRLKAKGYAGFGGLSGIDVKPDGEFISQSDAGDLIRGRILLDDKGRLSGLADTSLSYLLDEQGEPPKSKSAADAEDITFLDGGGFTVSFEQDHRVLVYSGEGPARRLATPPDPGMPGNSGIEALTQWRDPAAGGELRLIEGAEDGRAWSCDLEGAGCRQFLDPARDTPDKDFSLTGLDALPNGLGMVAVYRAYSTLRGMRALICWVRPGPERQVTVLGRLALPLNVDNFEGIAAVERPGGVIRLYIISDDNTSNLQRTLLMAFDWTPKPEESAK